MHAMPSRRGVDNDMCGAATATTQVSWSTVTVNDTFFINLRGISLEAHTAGVPRREALVIGLDRLDDDGVGNTLPTPLPLVDEEAVRTCGVAAAAKGGSTGRLFQGI
jgi:hypothetical protein